MITDEQQRKREFLFTDRDFQTIRVLIKDFSGIALSDGKEDMVYGRLTKRLRAQGLKTFKEYIKIVKHDTKGDEILHFTNALTTNLTSFFREPHHFEHLKRVVLPHLMKMNDSSRRIRIWSAGCSTGEEPYSIAMTVAETMPPGWDVKILATDLDSNVLATGAAGVYEEARFTGMKKHQLKRWFDKGTGSNEGKARVKPVLRDMISFKQLNLMEEWPIKGPLDVIFCRNVIIYFDAPTKAKLAERYFDLLQDYGTMFIGHSETLMGVTKRAKLVGKTIYEKA